MAGFPLVGTQCRSRRSWLSFPSDERREMEWAGDQPVLALICNISLPDDEMTISQKGRDEAPRTTRGTLWKRKGTPALHRKRSCPHV